MIRPILPQYNDDEVNQFHPVFEYAGNQMLRDNSLDGEFELKHHHTIGSGIVVDFAFVRRATGKIILLCELKRTIGSVRSLRNINQAKTYSTEAGTQIETNYYLISNLEIIDLYKNDPSKPRVFSQIVSPSPLVVGKLQITSVDVFYTNLTSAIKEVFLTAKNDTGIYHNGLMEIQEQLFNTIGNKTKWHQIFMPCGFEYIRGAASTLPLLANKIRIARWDLAENYLSNPSQMITHGNQVDFDALFSTPHPNLGDRDCFNSTILNNIYETGRKSGDASELSLLVEELMLPQGPGIVQTDEELADIVAIMAYCSLNRELTEEEEIYDPGAGCGNLLVAATKTFNSLSPKQIKANDIEEQFKEILSIRLGLLFSEVISDTNKPNISTRNIVELNRPEFQNVKVILMNPPFISGINSVNEKKRLETKVKLLRSGRDSYLAVGQIGFEALFLENAWELATEGTIIVSIFPRRYLDADSAETRAFRNFLTHNFVLTDIVLYPRIGIFEDVIKQTIILVGTKGASRDYVRLINISLPLENIDRSILKRGIVDNNPTPHRGVTIKQIPLNELIQKNNVGWNDFIGITSEIRLWFDNISNNMTTISGTGIRLYRGIAGNSGGSNICFFKSNDPQKYRSLNLPDSWMHPGIRNADDAAQIINEDNCPNLSPVLPSIFNQASTNRLSSVSSAYLIAYPINMSKGKQRKKNKTVDDIKSILSKNRLSASGSLLIPRAIRRYGRISVIEVPCVISTNFAVYDIQDPIKAKLYASWLSSVFGQINMELEIISQEGERKLEMKQINNLFLPNIDALPDDTKNQLIRAFSVEPPLDFQSLQIRQTDLIWATHLFHNRATTILNEAFENLQYLIKKRLND